MKILQNLICFGLRHAVGEVGADVAGKAIEFLVARFSDDSQALPNALLAAHKRTWHALEVALAGDGFFDKCSRVLGADQTTRNIRNQVEPFLRAASLDRLPEKSRKACLAELKKLRDSDEFKSGDFPAADFKSELKNWQRYGDPRGVIEGACQAVERVAQALEKNYPNLSRLVQQRAGDAPPLLASLFAFFLREEIRKNKELAAALTFDLLRNLFAAQETAFAGVGLALDAIGDKLDAILDQLDRIEGKVDVTLGVVLDIRTVLQGYLGGDTHDRLVEEIALGVMAHLERHGMQRTVLSVRHSSIIQNEEEREAVQALLHQWRQLPSEQRRQVPALLTSTVLNGFGQLLVGANEAKQASAVFVEAARSATDDAARAEIQYNAYRAAVEQRDWDAALAALRQAATFDAARFTFFPAHRYQVKRILGAGGFGTAFQCYDDNLEREVVVKTLHEDLMERSVKEAFNEARAASSLSHPAIIGVYDGDYADPVRKKRPYIVMEYFAGVTLRAYVEKNGELSPEKYAVVARQIVSGMTAAHRQGVVHRDLKPDNILIDDKLGVKIIDFGLALRRQVVETDAKQAGAPTVLARSAAGTLAYSAPEQMGRIAGVKVGVYSDVFAFGKTSWFALFNLENPASPNRRHLAKLPNPLADLLEKCTEYHPKDRYTDFKPVWEHFNGGEDQAKHQQRQADGEKKLAEVLRGLFDQSGGDKSKLDLSAAKALCREFGIPTERGQEIIQKSWDQWRKAHQKVEPPAPPKPPTRLTAPFTSHEAKEAQAAWAKYLGRKVEEEIDLGGGVKLALLLIPPGTFTMGSPEGEKERGTDEVAHLVTIAKPFYLGKYPVTQEQYEKVVEINPSYFKAGADGHASVAGLDTRQFPVEQVSWEDADAFCHMAGKKVAWGSMILPAEAQWEYACRAGTRTPFHFGLENNGNQCNCDGNHPYGTATKGEYLVRTCKVGGDKIAYKPNAFGLFDMSGNVWEWCLDYYGPYEGLDKQDPIQLNNSSDNRRVLRGGSWGSGSRGGRAANRCRFDPGNLYIIIGFRVCVRLD